MFSRKPVIKSGIEHHWGRGMMMEAEEINGGIYMASNVTNSTLFYDAEIKKEKMAKVPNGDCRFLRKYLGNPIFSRADMIYWMTDRTPHEALPTPSGPRVRSEPLEGHASLTTTVTISDPPFPPRVARSNSYE